LAELAGNASVRAARGGEAGWQRGTIGDLGSTAAGAAGDAPESSLRESLRAFGAVLAHHQPRRLALIVLVQIASSVCQSVALLLLIPLLGTVGVGAASGLARTINGIFRFVGLRPTLVTVLAIYVALTALVAPLSVIQSVLATRYRLEFIDRLRTRLYGTIAGASWSHLLTLRRSDVLAVLNSNVSMTGQGVQAALAIVVAALLSVSQLTVSVIISPPVTVLAVASGLVLVLVVWPLVRRSRRLGLELTKRNRTVQALAIGFLDSLKLTKAYGCEQEHLSAYSGALAAARTPQIEFARVSAMAGGAQSLLRAAMLAITVLVAVQVVHVPVSYLFVIAVVFNRVVGLMIGVQGSIQSIAQALPALEEITAMSAGCAEAAEVTEPEFEGAGETRPTVLGRRARERLSIGEGISLRDVHFSYPAQPDGVEALRGVSLVVPAGSMIALAGPTGAGKTTVADLVVGLIAPCSGEIVVAGRALTRDNAARWRESVALVPQDPFLFHDSVKANLRWARPDASEDQLWRVLEQAAVADFVENLPEGLDTLVGDRGIRLSGGERQRIALARALLREPELLVLDEATSALDTKTERSIRQALAELQGQMTMLVVAHRLTTAREADQIIVLEAGRVIEAGTWEGLSELPMGRLSALIQASDAPVARGHWARGLGVPRARSSARVPPS
jgi:ATP-binding cassette, subfamily C, bacterial